MVSPIEATPEEIRFLAHRDTYITPPRVREMALPLTDAVREDIQSSGTLPPFTFRAIVYNPDKSKMLFAGAAEVYADRAHAFWPLNAIPDFFNLDLRAAEWFKVSNQPEWSSSFLPWYIIVPKEASTERYESPPKRSRLMTNQQLREALDEAEAEITRLRGEMLGPDDAAAPS